MSNKVELVYKSENGGYSGIILKEGEMIPVKEIQDVIVSMGGRLSKE